MDVSRSASTIAATPAPPTGSPDAPTEPSAAPQLPVSRDMTPSGRPQWYGQALAKQERSWFSRTGDVQLYAGNTFPTSFSRFADAVEHARAASTGEKGAVFVMRPRHVGDDSGAHHHRHPFFLTRSYNAEYTRDKGLYVGQTQLDGQERLSDWHPTVEAVVDGPVLLMRPGHHGHGPHR